LLLIVFIVFCFTDFIFSEFPKFYGFVSLVGLITKKSQIFQIRVTISVLELLLELKLELFL